MSDMEATGAMIIATIIITITVRVPDRPIAPTAPIVPIDLTVPGLGRREDNRRLL